MSSHRPAAVPTAVQVIEAERRLRTRAHDGVTTDMAVAAAERAGVCIRPLLRQVTDRATGAVSTVPIACGSTREKVCPSCAVKARRLRMHQCREGWHLTEDPPRHLDTDRLDDEEQPEEEEEDEDQEDEASDEGAQPRRVRSTRHLSGFPDLPTLPVQDRTIGTAFTDERTGRTYRPSMFLTLTLPSYGKVLPGTGVPRNPARYDYRRAALDALLFPRLVDRFWQNLRRAAGYKVQYFAAVEPQRRLAPHLHAAVRGAIPRATIKAVARGTYAAIWWPSIDEVVYDGDTLPVWDRDREAYADPATGAALPTWQDALDRLDADPVGEDVEPMHVLTFGAQVDIKGLLGGTPNSDRAVRYLCKYLTKSIADTYAQTAHTDRADDELDPTAVAYERHIDRLHREVRWLPCSPACANWLRHGIQPKDPGPGLIPGACPSKAHDRDHLGLGGRRVLVSRHWSGKTLTQHKADRVAVVRAVLTEAGIDAPEADRLAADVLHQDGLPRFVWEDVPVCERDYTAVITASLRQAQRWRTQYDDAKRAAAQRDSPRGSPPDGPVDSHSANSPTAASMVGSYEEENDGTTVEPR
ncbi:replication initiator [Terrabacter sp. Ter38]|uniref:replication initiator n=1 Tax=Terrabacter sp. Ter38 TaxID=2926030 RepID=UPI002119677E|nr:replication initiator [Terrabacter sp. Ter38]